MNLIFLFIALKFSPLFFQVYIGLDQPLAALDVYKQGLEKFPEETYLMGHTARIYEVKFYFCDFHLLETFLSYYNFNEFIMSVFLRILFKKLDIIFHLLISLNFLLTIDLTCL